MGVMEGNGRVTEAQKEMNASLLNAENFSLNTLYNWRGNGIQAEIREHVAGALENVDVFLPVYNQQETLSRTLDYVMKQHKIPPEQITAVNCSDPHDKSGDILEQYGIQAVDQWKTLQDLVDVEKLKDLCQINDLRDIRGKGLTMFTGYLHRYMLHQQGLDKRPYNRHVIQTDTDIGNIGTGPEEWDPLSYFAYFGLRKEPNLDLIKASKVGRNNEPFYVFNNAISALGPWGKKLKPGLSKDIWPLTGEYGFKRSFPETQVVYPSGYPIEMMMNARREELSLFWRQVATPEARRDGQNDWNKEIPMYADIQRMMMAIGMQISLKGYGNMGNLTLQDIQAINQNVAEDDLTFVHDTTKVVPVTAKPLRVSRLIGNIPNLLREGVIYSGR